MTTTKLPHPSLKVKVYNRDGYYFTHKDMTIDHIPIWEPLLKSYQEKPLKILEIGSLQGNSAIYWLTKVLNHSSSKLWCIEPFQRTKRVPDRELFLENIGKTGQAKKMTLLEMTSDQAFNKLPSILPNILFDIIYVDGSHEAEVVARDATSSFHFVKQGGIIIFDDYKMPRVFAIDKIGPKPSIDEFLDKYQDSLDILHSGYQVIVRKK